MYVFVFPIWTRVPLQGVLARKNLLWCKKNVSNSLLQSKERLFVKSTLFVSFVRIDAQQKNLSASSLLFEKKKPHLPHQRNVTCTRRCTHCYAMYYWDLVVSHTTDYSCQCVRIDYICICRLLYYTTTSFRNVSGIVNEHAKIVNFLTHNTHFSAVSDKNDGIASKFAKLLVFLTSESKTKTKTLVFYS